MLKRNLVLAAAVVFVSATLHAAPATCGAFVTVATLTTYNNNEEPGCVSGDKIFTNFDTNLPSTLFLQLIQFEAGPGPDVHGWSLLTSGLAGGTYNFGYTIAVNLATNPLMRIATAQLDASGGTGATYTATKSVNSGQYLLTVTNLSGQASTSILPLATALTIRDDFTFSGPLTSLVNSFTQTEIEGVPEPVTMALVGSGFLALGLFRRFRRK